MKLITLKTIIIFATMLIPVSVYAWWDSYWYHKVPISIDNTSATAVTNYQIKLEINTTNCPNFVWANNGDDIHFVDTDDNTLLSHFLEDYDAIAMTATVWVNIPIISATSSHTINLYYDNAAALSSTDASSTFSQTGIKYHTKNSTFDPPDNSSAISTFNSTADGIAGYGCTHFNDFNAITNRNQFGTIGSNNTNIIYNSEMVFNVPTAATWEFRFGGDGGNGGSIYVDNMVIEELWHPAGRADDIWWANSWANYETSQDILYGSRFLSSGFHVLRVLAYEPCCDGNATLQFSTDSGNNWQAFNTTNLSIISPQCPVSEITNSFGTEETFDVDIAYVRSLLDDNLLTVTWTSDTESFNIGYNIWVENDQQHWFKLNKNIIPSKNPQSLNPIDYEVTFELFDNINLFQISSIDNKGHEDFYRSFELNKVYGSKPSNAKIDWLTIKNKSIKLKNKRFIDQLNKTVSDNIIINIKTNQAGIMRIYFDELIPYGLDLTDFNNREIAVSLKGKAIARFIESNSTRHYIEFFISQLSDNDSLYLDNATYQISINPQLVRHISPNNPIVADTLTQSYTNEIKRDINLEYNFASSSNDPWFEKLIFNSGTGDEYSIDFSLSDEINLQQQFKFSLNFMGLTNFPGNPQLNPDHHLKISLNQTEIYNATADGLCDWLVNLSINGHLLKTGINSLSFELLNDTGFAVDLVYFDKFTLAYSQSLTTSNNKLLFNNSSANTQFELQGFTDENLIAYGINHEGELFQLKLSTTENNSDRIFFDNFQSENNQKYYLNGLNDVAHNNYWVSSEDNLLHPQTIEISTSHTPSYSNANYLIIAHPDFINGSLQTFNQSKLTQGYDSEIINWHDIVTQYGHGYATPETLQKYLSQRYQRNPFHYVLLVGGQTYDYHDYLNNHAICFIPTYYRPTTTQVNFTPTDFPYTDINTDGFPDFALGRWPVRTPEELNNIVNKTIQWQNTHPKSNLQTLLIAEQKDQSNIDFAMQTNNIANEINLNEINTTRVFVDDYILDDSIHAVTNARNDIINSINSGIDSIIYDGHGSPTAWSFQGLIRTQHISQLNNINQSVIISPLSCYTTYYENPSTNTLAHQWLFSGQHGALAIHGAMVLSHYQTNQMMTVNILKSMLDDKSTIGDAILLVKNTLAPNDDLLINWNLLGDPTLIF